jgi:hypothetical protein
LVPFASNGPQAITLPHQVRFARRGQHATGQPEAANTVVYHIREATGNGYSAERETVTRDRHISRAGLGLALPKIAG